MAKQIGYAVLGAGELARKAILPAFARAAENSRLVAVISSDRPEAQTVTQEFPYHVDALRQCLARDEVNAVWIAVPNAPHCDSPWKPRARARTCSASGRWRSPRTNAAACCARVRPTA